MHVCLAMQALTSWLHQDWGPRSHFQYFQKLDKNSIAERATDYTVYSSTTIQDKVSTKILTLQRIHKPSQDDTSCLDLAAGAEVLPDSDDERLLDMVMLRLRLADGLDLTSLAAQHGKAAAATVLKALQPHAARGLVEFEEAGTPQIARLSDPNGFLVSNHIISDIFAALD